MSLITGIGGLAIQDQHRSSGPHMKDVLTDKWNVCARGVCRSRRMKRVRVPFATIAYGVQGSMQTVVNDSRCNVL